MVEIIVEYKITNNGNETTNHFRLRVLPEVADNGTTVTGRKGIYSTEVDNVAGLTINTDGTWAFDPSNQTYNQLALGDEQEIMIEYAVEDNDKLNSTNNFTITIAGSNDNPVVTGAAVNLINATEDLTYDISVKDLLAPYSDVDSGDTINVEALTPYQAQLVNGEYIPTTVLAGSVTLKQVNGEDVYEFVPRDDFNGKVYLSYTVADGNGPGYKAHTLFEVAAVQDAPTLGKLSGSGLFLGEILEDTSQVYTEAQLLEFYIDADNDTLSIVNGSVSSPNGTITKNSENNYVFTPTEHFSGSTQISFKITDSAPGSPNEITVEKFLKSNCC